jgi:hypothetical protein
VDGRRRRGIASSSCGGHRFGRGCRLDRPGANPQSGRVVRCSEPHPRPATHHGAVTELLLSWRGDAPVAKGGRA